MATIDDLPIPDFSTLSDEELMNLIREARGRRRNPDPEVKAQSVKKATSKARKGKAAALQHVEAMIKGLTPEKAAELLAKLKGGQDE